MWFTSANDTTTNNNNDNANINTTPAVISVDAEGLTDSGVSQLTPFDASAYQIPMQPNNNSFSNIEATESGIHLSDNNSSSAQKDDEAFSSSHIAQDGSIRTSTGTTDQGVTTSNKSHGNVKKVLANPKEFESSLTSKKAATIAKTLNQEQEEEQGQQKQQNKTISPTSKALNIKKNEIVEMKENMIRIFWENEGDDDYMEVTQEQLDRTRMMHAKIEEGAMFTFNYNTLILCAAIIAGLGLVSNGGAAIIASMLISPLMGPVVGLAYGITIRDWKLVRRSLRTEGISLLFCIIIGMLIGLTTGPTLVSENWPTPEMANRGTWQNLYIGCPVAFFSGMGVAVSLLDDQTASMVGVAISASLLPPAVNAGILWVAYIFEQTNSDILAPQTLSIPCACFVQNITNSEEMSYNNTSSLDSFTEATFRDTLFGLGITQSSSDNYEESPTYYSASEYFNMGMISLLLTLANIVLIIVSSMLMFRIKEVLPIRKKVFWEDLKVARKVYQQKAYIQRYVVTDDDADEDINTNTNNCHKKEDPPATDN